MPQTIAIAESGGATMGQVLRASLFFTLMVAATAKSLDRTAADQFARRVPVLRLMRGAAVVVMILIDLAAAVLVAWGGALVAGASLAALFLAFAVLQAHPAAVSGCGCFGKLSRRHRARWRAAASRLAGVAGGVVLASGHSRALTPGALGALTVLSVATSYAIARPGSAGAETAPALQGNDGEAMAHVQVGRRPLLRGAALAIGLLSLDASLWSTTAALAIDEGSCGEVGACCSGNCYYEAYVCSVQHTYPENVCANLIPTCIEYCYISESNCQNVAEEGTGYAGCCQVSYMPEWRACGGSDGCT